MPPTRRPRRLLALATVGALMAVGAAACSDDDAGSGDTADATAWCAGFDRFTAATLRLDSDNSTESLDDVQAEIGKLRDLPAPGAIADDRTAIDQALDTTATGGLQPTTEQTEAGRRVAAWARDNCDLSPEVRTAIEDAGE